MMYQYAIGSIFAFLCMIISVLFGQFLNPTSDQDITEPILEPQEEPTEETQEETTEPQE
jgi:hypothetical protein